MTLYESPVYQEDIKKTASCGFIDVLKDTTVVISGATGMIGSFLIDVILKKNREEGFGCKVVALGRSTEKANKRFGEESFSEGLTFIECNINDSVPDIKGDADYILHLASNTHPVAYATDPIGTVLTNIKGALNLLDFAVEHKTKRFVYASSVEVYGENRGDTEKFREDYCGYIDSNTLRAGYPESKRCGEALCQAYIKQKGLDIVLPRLSRVFGPTMLMSDTKAVSQFIKKAAAGEDIVLKSKGDQLYSYSYVADSVTGILCVMDKGETGGAYNIANPDLDITLADLAATLAESAGTRVVFELPDEREQAGYSKATKATLDPSKLMGLGWQPGFDAKTSLLHTVSVIRETADA